MPPQSVCVFWFRRDLRLDDNSGLSAAIQSGFPVVPIFIFDRTILDALEEKADARVAFIYQEVRRLKEHIRQLGGDLKIFHASPAESFDRLLSEFDVKVVFANRDYEPYALKRDKFIYDSLKEKNIPFRGFKDQVIFDRNEVMKDDGKPYTVFTPYSRKWKSLLTPGHLSAADTSQLGTSLLKQPPSPMPQLEELGFTDPEIPIPSRHIEPAILDRYAEQRDIPSLPGTSRISLHLRFGTVSIRELVRIAKTRSEKWLDELIWREFYQMVIYHFPHSAESSFKPAYDRIVWRNDPKGFEAWCRGMTGYPMVDAGMRELNATGFMHNRVRMVTASFLTKHLLIDWRLGERYFAGKLLDFELASNVGGWQWACGSGCDAAPYFRIFNPQSQLEKFDPNHDYIRQWIPEWGTSSYPSPIVVHKEARERCLSVFKAALQEN